MLFNPEHPKKAASTICFVPLGMTVFLHPIISVSVPFCIKALQLSLESYTVFFSLTAILISPEQCMKVSFPILTTLSGIYIFLKLSQ